MDHANDFYKSLLDNLYDGVYFVDNDRRITYWNGGAERMTGYSGGEVLSRHCQDNLLRHVNEEGRLLCQEACPLIHAMDDGSPHEAEIYLRHAEGHRVPVLVRVSPMRDASGAIVGAVEVFSNNAALLAARRQAYELRAEAQTDALTGLANRRRLTNAIANGLTENLQGGAAVGLLFIDIDHFKDFNDQCGHDVGDAMLKVVAETLRCNVRAGDVVGRWGGEEFLVVAACPDLPALNTLANKLRALVERSGLEYGGRTQRATISIGAALARRDDTPDSLLKRADELLYHSKQDGRNGVTALA